MNKSNLNVFTYDYYPWKYPRNWFRNIKQFFKNIKWAWQRATKGFADRDTWNMDYFYAELFADSLKRLAENSYGYPHKLANFEEWQRLLLEASENFRNYNKEEESDLFEVYMKEGSAEARDNWLKAEKDTDTFRVDSLNEGLDFLKNWFTNLWD